MATRHLRPGGRARIDGVIADEEGHALAGVVVVDEKTGTYTTSDSRGRYKLTLPKGETNISFTDVEKENQTLNVILYGDRDLVCEILALDNETLDCHFSPVDPFVLPEHPDIPSLRLSPSMRNALTARHFSLKASVKVDTLYEFLPKRDNLLLSSDDAISYHLDDYTRFDTVEDIIVELIPQVSVQKIRGRKQLKMGLEDLATHGRSLNVLAMLDGVPVSNHERLLAFDALALSDVIVYPYMYALGNTIFSGVVNFVTAKRDMSALQFNNNVRIVDFRGCSYPVALKSHVEIDGATSGRTLFWQPLITIPAGGQIDIEVPGTDAPWSVRIFGYSAE